MWQGPCSQKSVIRGMKTWHKFLLYFVLTVGQWVPFLATSQTPEPPPPPPKVEFVDYNTLDHSIIITKIRAGNHDPEGINQYFFTVKFIGLINKTEEKKLDPAEQKISAKKRGNSASSPCLPWVIGNRMPKRKRSNIPLRSREQAWEHSPQKWCSSSKSKNRKWLFGWISTCGRRKRNITFWPMTKS